MSENLTPDNELLEDNENFQALAGFDEEGIEE